ncbi:MAG: sugar ABC transporter substrate-binding protein [Christensenellales bacterium]|jgi:ABC-type sugar transport system substrate-binding protein
MKKFKNLPASRLIVFIMALILILSTATALATEELPQPKRKYRIVFTMFNGTNPVAREIEAGFVDTAKALGIDLWVMDNELDPVKMNANADLAVAAGDVDFYVLYTNDIASNPQIMDKLVAANIPVLTIATAAIASDGTEAPLIFSADDNYDSAYLAAETLAKAAQEKGWAEEDCTFVSMGFLEAGGVFLIRTKGALEGMHSVFPNVEYIETSSTGSTEVAFQRTADILMTLPEGKKLLGWTHSDDVTASMMAALQNAGRLEDGLLVSNGLSMQMLDMLRDPNGIIVGSIDMNWAKFGPQVLTYAINYLNDGTPIPLVINAPYELLTPATVNNKYPPK